MLVLSIGIVIGAVGISFYPKTATKIKETITDWIKKINE